MRLTFASTTAYVNKGTVEWHNKLCQTLLMKVVKMQSTKVAVSFFFALQSLSLD